MSDFIVQEPIILASGSLIRKKLLVSTGLEFNVIKATCDEDELKQSLKDISPDKLGQYLAKEKALDVSKKYPEHYIIAADQICVMGDIIFDKPITHDKAMSQLNRLQGNVHQQISCLCIAKDEKILWQHQEKANLTMRKLSRDALEKYLLCDEPYQSCGSYQFEAKGKWLFEQVEGQEDTILGLPLMPLEKALLSVGAVKLTQSM